ncbi:MAG TPA: transcriptional regulator NrdR [Candidatus Nitrosotenuis sp.]|nr:transcriptional regulator NrdR [Candidatus Nitrosotenuis sp.]
MHCPYCDHTETRVLDSRLIDDGRSIRRRRECSSCGRRFRTYERHEEAPLVVCKKDGRREKFQRRKVLEGMLRATEKRPVSYDEIERLATQIEQNLRSRGEGEVSSEEIGRMVMEHLRRLDEVAYVRFASVYKRFQALSEFREELEALEAAREPSPGGQPPGPG